MPEQLVYQSHALIWSRQQSPSQAEIVLDIILQCFQVDM